MLVGRGYLVIYVCMYIYTHVLINVLNVAVNIECLSCMWFVLFL